ncbi:MAG: endonuclease III [Clostridiales bacterium]|nr:endonuclease III [Clostridiales bacterium]
MKNLDEIQKIMLLLDEAYPLDIFCYLAYDKPWQLLIATILSAQCTDARVNSITPGLFAKYPTLEDFAKSCLEKLESDIKPAGFYHTKAKHIKETCKALCEDFGGELPSEMDMLTTLPGVGRKTANLIRGHIFNIPSIIVDTHVKRISAKLGFTENEDPAKIEIELMGILPQEHWTRYNTQIIAHGRAICTARNPHCASCVFSELCDWRKRGFDSKPIMKKKKA